MPGTAAFEGGETVLFDPFAGTVIGAPPQALRSFFRTMTTWHRYLALEGPNRPFGKGVTGAANLGFLFAKASQRWNELLAARFSELGYPEVRPSYGSVLLPLFEEDNLRMGEIAARARLSKQTMTTLVRLAERDGLVTRAADSTDGRATRISLTRRASEFSAVAEMVVAFVPPGNRLVEYANNAPHARFIARELVPELTADLPLVDSPVGRTLMGSSFGGVASVSTAARSECRRSAGSVTRQLFRP